MSAKKRRILAAVSNFLSKCMQLLSPLITGIYKNNGSTKTAKRHDITNILFHLCKNGPWGSRTLVLRFLSSEADLFWVSECEEFPKNEKAPAVLPFSNPKTLCPFSETTLSETTETDCSDLQSWNLGITKAIEKVALRICEFSADHRMNLAPHISTEAVFPSNNGKIFFQNKKAGR